MPVVVRAIVRVGVLIQEGGRRRAVRQVRLHLGRDGPVVGLLPRAMRLAFDFPSVRKCQHSCISRLRLIRRHASYRASHPKFVLQLSYRIVLDADDLVALHDGLLQLLDLGEQDLHLQGRLLLIDGVVGGVKLMLRVVHRLFWVEVRQLLVDLIMIGQYLADSVKITIQQVFIGRDFKWFAIVATMVLRQALQGWPPVTSGSHRACLLQIGGHQVLVPLESACMRAALHGGEHVVLLVLRPCVRMCRRVELLVQVWLAELVGRLACIGLLVGGSVAAGFRVLVVLGGGTSIAGQVVLLL